jgi:hypothetical protein
MDKKRYALYSVVEFRKRSSTQTITILREPTYATTANIMGGVTMLTEDDDTPDFGDVFLVTVEKLPKLTNSGSWEPYDQIIKERQEKDAQVTPAPSGRKFR